MTVKGNLLEHYAGKEPCAFRQYDGFVVGQGDDVLRPDADGDSLSSRETMELMTGCPEVRVLCSPGCTYDEALRLLKKIRRWIKKDGPKAWDAATPRGGAQAAGQRANHNIGGET